MKLQRSRLTLFGTSLALAAASLFALPALADDGPATSLTNSAKNGMTAGSDTPGQASMSGANQSSSGAGQSAGTAGKALDSNPAHTTNAGSAAAKDTSAGGDMKKDRTPTSGIGETSGG